MKLITFEDLRDIYIKAYQRGLPFLSSKLTLSERERTRTAFDSTELETANWWIIPYVKQRWNRKITGHSDKTYEEYISEKYFLAKDHLRMISIGSGICSHEIKLAQLNPHWEVSCLDLSASLIDKASNLAKEKGLDNMKFYAEDVYTYNFEKDHYDLVLFHSSLHHFENIEHFVKNTVCPILKQDGYLVINEYVGPNRMQYHKEQIDTINRAISKIDKPYRKIFKTPLYKEKYYGSGVLRMRIADPSECVDSESILAVIHENFELIEEKPYGGNILMSTLKDISHHFVDLNQRKKEILDELFAVEDDFLRKHKSDFVFGVYKMK